MKYAYAVYTNSTGSFDTDRDYYLTDLSSSHLFISALTLGFGEEYQGFLCVI